MPQNVESEASAGVGRIVIGSCRLMSPVARRNSIRRRGMPSGVLVRRGSEQAGNSGFEPECNRATNPFGLRCERAFRPSDASVDLHACVFTPRGSIGDVGRRLSESRQLDRSGAVRPRVSPASCDSTTSESSIHGSTRSTTEGFVADVARSVQSYDLNTLAGSNRSGVPRTDSAKVSEAP